MLITRTKSNTVFSLDICFEVGGVAIKTLKQQKKGEGGGAYYRDYLERETI